MNLDRSKPYRCTIQPEDAACRIRIGRKDIVCELTDLSRDDFCVRVPAKYEKSVSKAKKIELRYHGERWQVAVNKQFKSDQPGVVMLDRQNELTPVKMPSPWNTLVSLRMSRETDPRFVLVLMLAFIAACISLPGIGDHLGTAPRIKNGVNSVVRTFK